MFAQRGKTGDNEGNGKEKKQRPRRKLDHINFNNCGEKGHYSGNSEWSTKTNLKENAEEFRKMKQEKYSKKNPDGEYQKSLINVKESSCSLMIGAPTK